MTFAQPVSALRRRARQLRALNLAMVRAAWWTIRAVHNARRQIEDGNFSEVALPRPPAVPSSAERGVRAVLRTTGASCLVRTTVRQAWFAAHGVRRDLVIGVTAPANGFEAHAWLEGDPGGERFHEILRLPAR